MYLVTKIIATAMSGTMQKFQPDTEPILAYLDRLDTYLHANAVVEEICSYMLVSTIGHKSST